MTTVASSYNVMIRVHAAKARREVREFSAELAAAKRMAQSMSGVTYGSRNANTTVSSNAQVSRSYDSVTKAASAATTATNAYTKAAAAAAAANARLVTTAAAVASTPAATGRKVAGRMGQAAPTDAFAAAAGRTRNAATSAGPAIADLDAKMRRYSNAARTAAKNTGLLESALLRLVPAAGMATTMMSQLNAQAAGAATNLAGAAASSAAATRGMTKANKAGAVVADEAADAFTDQMNRVRSLGASMTWAGRQISMTFTLPFALAAGAATVWQLDVERAATRMQKVYDDLGDGIVQITGDDGKLTFNGSPMDRFLTALSNKMGQSKAELTEIAADWAAVGLMGGNLAAATKLTSEAMVLGDMEAAEAREALVAIQAQYNLAFGDFATEAERARRIAEGDADAAREAAEEKVTLTGVLAQLNMVENQTATSMQDLILGFSRSAVFAKEAGVEANYLAAHLAALIPATGTAERAGNALKTIYASLSTDKSKPQIAALERLAQSAGLAADAFTSAEFRSKGMQTGIEDIARAYANLAPADKLQWGKDVFGIYQMVRGMHLLDDVARGIGATFNESGKSMDILATQFSNLTTEGAKLNFVQREFGATGEEAMAVMEQLSEHAKTVGNDVSYYRQALSGQDPTKTYKQYASELTQVLQSNPQKIKQAWVIIQNSMMKVIVPLIPTIVSIAQTLARLANAFANLDPRVQKLAIYFGLFLALIGPLAIILGSTLLMFSVMAKAAAFLGLRMGFLGGKTAGVGAAFRGLMRFLSGGRLFAPVATSATAAGNAMATGVTAQATGLGPRLAGIFGRLGGFIKPVLTKSLGGIVSALARFGPMLIKTITGPVGWAVTAVAGLMELGGTSVIGAYKDLFGGMGKIARDAMYDGNIPIIARPFVAGVEMIGKVLSGLPRYVNAVFTGVARGITRIAKSIYKAFSYINPFARHSPSLVENVTNGMSIVADRFAVAGASISTTMRSAYADIAAFGSKTASLKLRADQAEVSQKRQVVSANAPQALPEFDRLVSARGALAAELEAVNARVKAQKLVVDAAQRSIDAYDRTLETMNRSLEMSQRRLDGLTEALSVAQDRYDYFASANIAGLAEMEDAIFANEMAQKRLQLAMSDAGADELDATSDLLSRIAGQIDDLAGRRNDLRMAGAGSDILGVYDAQIAGLRGQQSALDGPASAIRTMSDELDALKRQADRMELEKSLAFDPLTRQIERFKNTSATLPFSQIMSGMAASRAQTEAYQGQIDSLNASIDSQRDAITRVEDARYLAVEAQKAQQLVLDDLTRSQSELETAISDIDAAISLAVDSVEKYTAALEEAKRASDDLAASGGTDAAAGAAGDFDPGMAAGEFDPGAALDIPGEADIEAMISEMEKSLEDSFGRIDLFPSFSELGEKIKRWWTETVVPAILGLPAALGNAIGGLTGGVSYIIGFLLGTVGSWSVKLNEWVTEKQQMIAGAVLSLWGWLFTELPRIVKEIDWSSVWDNVLSLADPQFWEDLKVKVYLKLYELGTTFLPGLWDGIKSVGSNIWGWVNDHIVTPFVDGFKRGFDIQSPSRVMFDLGVDVIQGLLDGLGDWMFRVVEFVAGIPGRVLSAIGNVGRVLYDTGRNIIQGLLDGMGGLLKDIGRFMADKLPRGIQGPFKKAMGIESPSKVFAEYGRNLGEGLIVGMEDVASQVSSATQALTSAATPGTPAAPSAAPAAAPVEAGPDPFAQMLTDAQATMPQIEQVAVGAAQQMAAGYTATLSGMEQQVLVGQQAYNVAYATNTAALSAHTIAMAAQTSTATVATATAMSMQTITIAQQMSVGVTSATNTMATGVVGSATSMADGVLAAMNAMSNGINGVVNGQIAPIMATFDPMLRGVVGWFDAATNNIGTIWAGVQPRTADPARFVINEVYDTGLRGAWNSFNEFLGLDPLPSHRAAFATGGVMPGYTPGRDVHRFISPTGGQLDLSGGEAIMRPEWTRAVGGPAAVEAMNKAARSGRFRMARAENSANRQAFANGGIVAAMDRIVKMKYPQMLLTSAGRNSADLHGAGMAGDFAWPGAFGNHPAQLALARDIAKTYPNSMELIYDSPGWANNIKNGANVGAFGQFYTMAQAGNHQHHVHWAMNTPPTMPFGGGVFLGGSSGEGAGGAGFTMDWGKYIGDAFKQAFDQIKDPAFAGGIGKWVPKSIDKAMKAKDFLAKKAEEMSSFQGDINDASGMVERWRPMMKAALIKQGLADWANDPAILDRFMRQIAHESGGNPSVTQGISDINSGGNEAEGLAQIAKSTWRIWRDPSLPDNWHDPWANLNTMARYVRGRYGPQGYMAIGNGIGYDSGGWLQPGLTTAVNATGKPEAILTAEQWNAIYRTVRDRPVDYTVSNADLARRVGEEVYGVVMPAGAAILGQAAADALADQEQHAEQVDFWTTFNAGLESLKSLAVDAKGVHEAVLSAVDQTNELLASDEKLAEVAELVTTALNEAFVSGGELPREQIAALERIATDYFAPVVELAREAIAAAEAGRPMDQTRVDELAESAQTAIAGVGKLISAWQPVVTSLTGMVSNIADLKQINLGAWASYGSPAGFGRVVERGLAHLGNIGIATFNLTKNVLPSLLNHGVSIGKTVVDFAATNAPAVAALVGAVVTGNPLAALPYLPQLLSLGLDLIPQIITAVQEIVPALIKGLFNLVQQFLFGGSNVYSYGTMEAAEKAIAQNIDAIRRGEFAPGSDVPSGSLSGGAGSTNVTINGDVVLPGIKTGGDANKFVTNLKALG